MCDEKNQDVVIYKDARIGEFSNFSTVYSEVTLKAIWTVLKYSFKPLS